jgi:hypothetical protein
MQCYVILLKLLFLQLHISGATESPQVVNKGHSNLLS